MTTTADKLIGYGLRVLKGPQPLYLGIPGPGKAPVKSFAVGSITPPIDSYAQIGDKLYWTFANPGGLSYYIEHKSGGTFEPIKYRETDTTQTAANQQGTSAGGGIFDALKGLAKMLPIALGGLILYNLTKK